MRTEKQIAASRANGALSRGPNSPRRPSAASDFGGLANIFLKNGEDRTMFRELVKDLTGHLKPESPLEHLLVGKMLAALWRQICLWHKGADADYRGAEETRLEAQFYRALDRYYKLRAASGAQFSLSDSPTDTYPDPEPAAEPAETHQNPNETRADENNPLPPESGDAS